MTRMPSLFIPHGGGPCFFMAWNPPGAWDRQRKFLEDVPATLPEKPRALLVISGHWEEPVFTVQTSPAPPLLFDYHGFPPHTYDLTWPASGDPALAARVRGLLEDAGFEVAEDPARGYDHGVFVPLKVAFPEADIPTVQLSLRADLDPEAHIAAGRALTPLRDEGVLIVGSGMSFHNLRYFASTDSRVIEAAQRFDDWLTTAVEAADETERARALETWAATPEAVFCHPRAEHLAPLFVVAGAAQGDRGRRTYSDRIIGKAVSGFQFG